MNDQIKIIHIIGFSGAGKTHFIRKFLPDYPVFDIKHIYQEYNFKPEDIQDPTRYSQFSTALRYQLNDLMRKMQVHNSEILVIETSGINQTINDEITSQDRLTVWIQSDFYKTTEKERAYAISLNKAILKAIEQRKINCDIIFNWHFKKFMQPLPKEYQRIFPKNIQDE